MSVIVQKYGGTSVADPARIARCAERAAAAYRTGHQVVVVVSAMGETTNRLIGLARSITPQPDPREMDVLLVTGEQTTAAIMAMTIQRLGVPAASLSNWQTGIRTDASHGRARIEAVDVAAIRQHLDAGRIAVVAGWTGTTSSGDVTTFGRGGSDMTAVALAAALNVSDHHGACEIYTDVAGVFTADPQIVPDARLHEQISFAAMIDLADRGAKVLHPRAAMIGQRYGVPIHVRDSFSHACGECRNGTTSGRGGTVVRANLQRTGEIVGCALLTDLARVRIGATADTQAIVRAICEAFGAANLQAIDLAPEPAMTPAGEGEIRFGDPGLSVGSSSYVKLAIRANELQDALAIVDWIRAEHPGCQRQVELGLCQVAVVADGPMADRQRIRTACERGLVNAINHGDHGGPARDPRLACEMTETSLVWTLASEHGRAALRAVHSASGLVSRAAMHATAPRAAAAS